MGLQLGKSLLEGKWSHGENVDIAEVTALVSERRQGPWGSVSRSWGHMEGQHLRELEALPHSQHNKGKEKEG